MQTRYYSLRGNRIEKAQFAKCLSREGEVSSTMKEGSRASFLVYDHLRACKNSVEVRMQVARWTSKESGVSSTMKEGSRSSFLDCDHLIILIFALRCLATSMRVFSSLWYNDTVFDRVYCLTRPTRFFADAVCIRG